MDIKFEQKQILELKLTREQIFSIELLELNAIELDTLITEEVCDNVILDYDKREDTISLDKLLKSYKKNKVYTESSAEDKDYSTLPLTYTEDFRKNLEKDFLTYKLSDKEKDIGKYIINNLKDSGYLDLKISEISKKFKVEEDYVENIRNKIKEIDNRGFASRNLMECLLVQIDKKDKLYDFVKYHLDKVAKNKLADIARDMDISIDEVNTLCERVRGLNPIPSGGEQSSGITQYIYPEILILEKNGELEVNILDTKENRLNFNEYYMNLYENTKDEELLEYLKMKYNRAVFFLEAIAKRRATIRKIVSAIVEIQREFFLNESSLKVCNLNILSEKTGLAESTISRAIKDKYLQSKQGVFPLKYFLVLGVGEEKTSKDEIYNLIEKIIREENEKKPYSDQKISDIMKEKGIDIKRRTVAKYREELGILPSNLRKKY